MVEISTSILNVKKENAVKTFYNLEVAKTDYFHIDVMDGKFVENDTLVLMKEYANAIKHISNLPLDVHLMVEEPQKYIEDFEELEPNIISIHFESFKTEEELLKCIEMIKNKNIKVGISIKPTTNVEKIFKFIPLIHLVLIMSVEPGKGGQTFIEKSYDRVKQLNEYINENNYETYIEVDGGINENNSKQLIKNGTNILVVGSSIINSDNYTKKIKKLKNM